MSDPKKDGVARIQEIVKLHREKQAILRAIVDKWTSKLSVIQGKAKDVIDAFENALAPDSKQWRCTVTIPNSQLVIRFLDRTISRSPMEAYAEKGAVAIFGCTEDGHVKGDRFPFLNEQLQRQKEEAFVDLGPGDKVESDDVAYAVAEFLEWASVGAGRGARRMNFA
jgi:hypothetical protein